MRGNRDESWRWRKEHTGKVDRSGSRKKGKMEESGDSVTGKALRPYRRAVGVAAKDKVEVLDSCVVAWCKRGLRGEALVVELQRASVGVCSVMRAAGDSVLLMFSSYEERRVFLDRTDLDQWFDRGGRWQAGWRGAGAGRGVDMVGIVCREVPPEPRMCEPEWWVQCSSELRGLEAAGELAVPRIEWREPVAVFESVSKSTLGGHPAVNLNFELEQTDILTGDLGGGGVENIQQTATTNFPSIELVQHNGLTRKVRSVNSLVVDSLPAKQRDRLLKRQGKKNRDGLRKEQGVR
ncbi:hypothetical protein V6N13_076178 [Hibiscus sabdariffa]